MCGYQGTLVTWNFPWKGRDVPSRGPNSLACGSSNRLKETRVLMSAERKVTMSSSDTR